MMNAKPSIPILRSFDEAAARAFYLDFLGFEIGFEHRFGPDAPLYMGVRLGECELHISEHYGDASPGGAVRIEIDDVAAYCAALNAKAYKFAKPGFQNQEWGWCEMTLTDPAKNRIIFCSALT